MRACQNSVLTHPPKQTWLAANHRFHQSSTRREASLQTGAVIFQCYFRLVEFDRAEGDGNHGQSSAELCIFLEPLRSPPIRTPVVRSQTRPGSGEKLPVDATTLICQRRSMLGETENQLYLTRAALSTGGRAKSKFLSVAFSGEHKPGGINPSASPLGWFFVGNQRPPIPAHP